MSDRSIVGIKRAKIFIMKNELIVLGIDPGFALTGYGVIKASSQKIEAIDFGCFETKVGEDFSDRLLYLSKELKKIIIKYKPDIVGVEELFFNKNVKTALKVAHARGVVLLVCGQFGIPAFEFTPTQVKQAISCYGRADKKQVQQMIKILLNLKKTPKPDDVADALAVAVCAANSYKIKSVYEK